MSAQNLNLLLQLTSGRQSATPSQGTAQAPEASAGAFLALMTKLEETLGQKTDDPQVALLEDGVTPKKGRGSFPAPSNIEDALAFLKNRHHALEAQAPDHVSGLASATSAPASPNDHKADLSANPAEDPATEGSRSPKPGHQAVTQTTAAALVPEASGVTQATAPATDASRAATVEAAPSIRKRADEARGIAPTVMPTSTDKGDPAAPSAPHGKTAIKTTVPASTTSLGAISSATPGAPTSTHPSAAPAQGRDAPAPAAQVAEIARTVEGLRTPQAVKAQPQPAAPAATPTTTTVSTASPSRGQSTADLSQFRDVVSAVYKESPEAGQEATPRRESIFQQAARQEVAPQLRPSEGARQTPSASVKAAGDGQATEKSTAGNGPNVAGVQTAAVARPATTLGSYSFADQQPAAPAPQEGIEEIAPRDLAARHVADPSNPMRPLDLPRHLAPVVSRQVHTAVLREGRGDGSSVKEIRISLRPERLGTVDVRIEMKDDVTRATIRTENPQTMELLRMDIRGLEQSLRDIGYRFEGGIQLETGEGQEDARDGALTQNQEGKDEGRRDQSGEADGHFMASPEAEASAPVVGDSELNLMV